MKKIFFLIAIATAAVSCRDLKGSAEDSAIEHDSLAKVVGIDKDKNGCVGSAGYKWSELKNNCIRPFEVGVRLNPVAEIKAGDPVVSAFVVLEEDGDKAELFLPNERYSLLMQRKSEDQPYVKDEWMLLTLKGFTLKKGDSVVYAGALIDEQAVTGSDKIDD